MRKIEDVKEDMRKLINEAYAMGCVDGAIQGYIQNCFITPKNATNGEVFLKMFPPSVYYGDNEKHIVLLAKDCELTCYNNEWWNAPYKVESEE